MWLYRYNFYNCDIGWDLVGENVRSKRCLTPSTHSYVIVFTKGAELPIWSRILYWLDIHLCAIAAMVLLYLMLTGGVPDFSQHTAFTVHDGRPRGH